MKFKSTLSEAKHFDFSGREGEIYSFWEKQGAFEGGKAQANGAKKGVFNISMPPPNANGELHLGHSSGYTVMDILGRFHRMLGEDVLLLPGKDHAGIQTQVVFEKKLAKEGINHKEVATEDLYRQCYDFCIDRAAYMRSQEKRLGLSADWSKELFTLDPRLSEIVFDTFERLWRDGLVYRGERIINWSVFSQTGISDVEVEHKEKEGFLWYFKYPLATYPLAERDSDAGKQGATSQIKLPNGEMVDFGVDGLIVATTRPETMLGDTALAVNPEDPRYQHLVGKFAVVPFLGRKIPIVADARVDFEFGTGVVKVTPAHDFLDFDIGTDHKLPMISVIGKDGRMTAEAGADFVGLKIEECRERVLERLQAEGLLLDTQKHTHKVPIGERGKDIIEPLLSEQWFINVDKPGMSLKKMALEKIRNGDVKIYPQRFQVMFEQWLENLRDWNISRQLWWGHRLPVWQRLSAGNKVEFHVGQSAPEGEGWEQETDTFDTWFSSGQWAFSTIAAHGLVELEKPESAYFPTHTMVMGRDILFFWACRMLLLTVYRTGKVPWRNIFFTGLVRDEHGRKMSKSAGNGIDPIEVINKHGADTLRLAHIIGATAGNDVALGERKIEGYGKFINKLWNAAKLIMLKCPMATEAFEGAEGGEQGQLNELKALLHPKLKSSQWILAETAKVYSSISAKLENYELSLASDELYNFTWQVFCDWYLEMMKVLVEGGEDVGESLEWKREVQLVTLEVFRSLLMLLHPFIPYVTEEIYQGMPGLRLRGATNRESLCLENWRDVNLEFEAKPSIQPLMEVIAGIRSVKAALGIPHQTIRASVSGELSVEDQYLIRELGRVELVKAELIREEQALRKPYSQGVVICEVDGKENYQKRLLKDLEANEKLIQSLEQKFAGDFVRFAKPEIVQKERERLEVAKRALVELTNELETLNGNGV